MHLATADLRQWQLCGQLREFGGWDLGGHQFRRPAVDAVEAEFPDPRRPGQDVTGRRGAVRHIPRPALHAMAWLTTAIKPALARQARAALVMDTRDMTFDAGATRRAFPDLPDIDLPSALKELLS